MQNSETVELSTQKRKIRNLHAVMSDVFKSNIHINIICRCASNFSLRCSVLSFYVIKHLQQLKIKSKKKLFSFLYKHYLILVLNSWN